MPSAAGNLRSGLFLVIDRMQQMMRFLAARLAEEFLVESLDVRVLMGETQGLAFVFRIDALHPFFEQSGIAVQIGLAAAVDAAAGARHDLDRLEPARFAADEFEHLAGVAEPGGHGDVHGEAGRDLDGRLFDAFEAFLAVKNRELEANSMRSYRSLVAIFRAWLLEHGFEGDAYANSVRGETAVAFMADFELKLAAKTYNNYVAFFRILFGWMVARGYTDVNPFDEIAKKRNRSAKNRRILTDEELARLIDYLQRENVPYLAMCMICYCCLIRPKEIAMLRCRDVDLVKQTVHVSASIAKNDSDSYRTIPNDLVPVLLALDYSDPERYLFADHDGWDFRPGVKMVCSRKIAKYWDAVVRPACGFGMNVKFYSLKDSGITNMLTDGVPVNLVQQQADHSSIAMTAVYVGRKASREELRQMRMLKNPKDS